MKQIKRNLTFETNSSSTHSLSIFNGDDAIEELDKIDSGNYTIEVGEYGWEKEEYNHPFDILSYLWTYATHHAQQYVPIIREYMPNTEFITPHYDSQYKYYDEGYIDHGDDYYDLEEVFEDRYSFAQAVIYGRVATWNDNTDHDSDPDFLEPKNAIRIFYKGN